MSQRAKKNTRRNGGPPKEQQDEAQQETKMEDGVFVRVMRKEGSMDIAAIQSIPTGGVAPAEVLSILTRARAQVEKVLEDVG